MITDFDFFLSLMITRFRTGWILLRSGNIPEYFSVMVSLNAVGYGKGKNLWFPEKAPEEKTPEVFPVFL